MPIPSLLVAALLLQAEPTVEPAAAPQLPPTMPMPAADAKPLLGALNLKATPYGYVDFQYSRTNAPAPKQDADTFEFRRARLGLKGEVTPQVGFTILYDGSDTSLKDAWVSLRYLPGIELRLGQFKTPFGYEQSESDTKLLWLYNSYAVAALARGRDSRDEGVLAVGSWAVTGPLTVEASAAAVNGAGPNAKDDLQDKGGWGRAGVLVKLPAVTARLGASGGYGHQLQTTGTDAKLGVQGSGSTATMDDTYFFFKTVGADLTVDTPWAFAAAEWMRSSRRVNRYTAPLSRKTTQIEPWGWYLGVYGKTPWSAGPVLRAEKAHLPTSSGAAQGTALTTGWNARYTVGAYYDVLPVNARLVVNYEFDESARAIRTGNRLIAMAQVVF